MESSTASWRQPYDDGSATDSSLRGAPTYPHEILLRVCDAIDAAGFDVHAHAIGDGAVRDVLDALEASSRLGRPRETRHTIAHLELVDDDDIGRFGALGVIAAKAADLVLLEADPFRAGIELPQCRVRLTMVAGRVVYEA